MRHPTQHEFDAMTEVERRSYYAACEAEEARAQGMTVAELREAHRRYEEEHTPTLDQIIDGVIGRAVLDPDYFEGAYR